VGGGTLAGIAAALIAAGRPVGEAVEIAARVNRLTGFYASPNPGTPVSEIIAQIPPALEEVLKEKEEVRNGTC
jgi:ADP-dependent NAD(P)H-hydrate dehydratase / NAD(P)H-hydrate epimerase